jgi:hypothetical protein
MKGTVAAAVVVAALAVALLAEVGHGALTCVEVDANLLPCAEYVTGKEAAPPALCCQGVKRIRALPAGTVERRFVCECIKSAAARFDGLKSDIARDLPAACGSPLPFPLALDFDCNTCVSYLSIVRVLSFFVLAFLIVCFTVRFVSVAASPEHELAPQDPP